jgi:glucose/arabinose dehydrogenase
MASCRTRIAIAAALTTAAAGCYNVLPSSGGAEASFEPPRQVQAADIALPAGYQIEAVATGLTFPTGIAFDDGGVPHVIEAGYSYGEVWTQPRLLRIDRDGGTQEVARGERNGPWTGVAFAQGAFFIAEGGELEGGRVLRIEPGGHKSILIQDLPSRGDHHTNGPAIGPDGRVYFAIGTATNSGIVGEDNLEFGWLKRFPEFHDVPCVDVEVAGINFESSDLTGTRGNATVRTGPFLPFGMAAEPGEVIKGRIPCSGAILSIRPDGSDLQLVAHGLRNPFGLAFAPDGELYVTENSFDDRGSRPIWGAGDVLWRVQPGAWFGWPDFAEGRSLASPEFRPPGSPEPTRLLARPLDTPPRPIAVLGVHASADGLDFSRSEQFGHVGQAFIAEFGDQSPTTGKSLHPVGFRVLRVDVTNGRIEDFAVNKGRKNGPGSKIGGGGLERPVAARFNPAGDALYVVDFGVLTEESKGSVPREKTGVVWRISKATR